MPRLLIYLFIYLFTYLFIYFESPKVLQRTSKLSKKGNCSLNIYRNFLPDL